MSWTWRVERMGGAPDEPAYGVVRVPEGFDSADAVFGPYWTPETAEHEARDKAAEFGGEVEVAV